MTDIYRVHAKYPHAMSSEVIDGTIKALPEMVRAALADPENFILSISEEPVGEYIGLSEFHPVTMGELEAWASME